MAPSALGAVILLTLAAVDLAPHPAVSPQPLADATLRFAVSLFNAQPDKPDNAILSPLNLTVASAMVLAGARGETARELDHALGWRGSSSELGDACRDLMHAMAQEARGDGVAFSAANAMWVDPQLPRLPPFDAALARHFGAPARPVDFTHAEQAARTINDWARASTTGHVSRLVDAASLGNAALVLTSALYFKSPWGEAFRDPTRAKGAFTGADKVSRDGPVLMKRHVHLRHAATERYTAVEIPYAAANLALDILLPHRDVGVAAFPDDLPEVLARLAPADVDMLQLPVFRFEAGFALEAALKKLGVTRVFSDGADLSGMTAARRLKLDHVLHQAYIAVDETGTEAAAATAQTMTYLSYPGPLRIVVDRPFLFVVRDTRSGAALFIGRVVQPATS